jgi:hypothetical protein
MVHIKYDSDAFWYSPANFATAYLNRARVYLIYRYHEEYIYLSDLRCFDRGKGYASKLLDSICELADANNVRLELNVFPRPDKNCLNRAQLIEFYKRKGFEFDEITHDSIKAPLGIRESKKKSDTTIIKPEVKSEFNKWFKDITEWYLEREQSNYSS